jgi:hypothetical protein
VRPGAANSLGQLLVGSTEVVKQLLIGSGLLQRVKLLAVQVLDERVTQQISVGSVPDNGRDLYQTGALGCPPPALTHDQLVVAAAYGAYHYRLQQPDLADRVS